jgi:uncharacterized protein (TIGR02996 family)
VSSLEKILADPDDDGARAVYADELVERGDPRGEFIQVQLRLEREDPEGEEHPRLLERSDRLLAEHGRTWFGWDEHEKLRVRRGFVEALDPVPLRAQKRFDELAAREPITSVELESPPPPSPATSRLTHLSLGDAIDGHSIPSLPPNLRGLTGWPDLEDNAFDFLEQMRFERLDLTLMERPPYGDSRSFIGRRAARIWRLPLVDLRLVANVELKLDGAFGGRRLDFGPLRPENLDELDQLTASANDLPALTAWSGRPRLRRLALHAFWPSTRSKVLANVKLGGLRDLELVHDLEPIRAADLAALARAPWAARLRVLRLHMEIEDPDALTALVKAMPRLTTLQARGLDADVARKLRGGRLVRVGDAHRKYALDWTESGR